MHHLPTLLTDISQTAEDHWKWGRWDFVFAQTLLWTGILSSVAAGVLAVLWTPQTTTGKASKIILAALPALVITAEQSFKFCQRYQWHDEYYAELHALENSLKYEGAKDAVVSEKESKVVKEMVAKFPSMTFQTLIPSAEKHGKTDKNPNKDDLEPQ